LVTVADSPQAGAGPHQVPRSALCQTMQLSWPILRRMREYAVPAAPNLALMELGRIGIYRCQAQDTGGGLREAAAELDDPPRGPRPDPMLRTSACVRLILTWCSSAEG